MALLHSDGHHGSGEIAGRAAPATAASFAATASSEFASVLCQELLGIGGHACAHLKVGLHVLHQGLEVESGAVHLVSFAQCESLSLRFGCRVYGRGFGSAGGDL